MGKSIRERVRYIYLQFPNASLLEEQVAKTERFNETTFEDRRRVTIIRLSYDPTVRLDEAFHLDGRHVGFEYCRMEDRTKVNTKWFRQNNIQCVHCVTCFYLLVFDETKDQKEAVTPRTTEAKSWLTFIPWQALQLPQFFVQNGAELVRTVSHESQCVKRESDAD